MGPAIRTNGFLHLHFTSVPEQACEAVANDSTCVTTLDAGRLIVTRWRGAAVDRRDETFIAALERAMERAKAARPHVPPGVRFELRRKILHVVTAIVAVPLLLVVPYAWALGLALVGIGVITLTWAIERRRLPRELAGPLHDELATVLERTRRPNEDYPWSPVLYTVALVIVATWHQFGGLAWSVVFAAYAILGIGDAASALVGVAYGRTRLPWNRKKSMEGTVAGLVAGFLAGVVLGAVPFAFAGLPIPPDFLAVVAAGAMAGSLAETIPRVEDNFVVPLAAAGTMALTAMALGLPLA